MNVAYLIAGLFVAGLFLDLAAALLKPEWFQ